MGNPYPPPKKNTTLWWVLGGVAAIIIILCCVGALLFAGIVGQAAEDTSRSYSDSYSGARADGATVVPMGDEASASEITVKSGWRLNGSDTLTGLVLRNDGSSSDSLVLTFFFMKDGAVLDDATCTTELLDAGASDYDPACLGPHSSIDGYDEIRIAEGY